MPPLLQRGGGIVLPLCHPHLLDPTLACPKCSTVNSPERARAVAGCQPLTLSHAVPAAATFSPLALLWAPPRPPPFPTLTPHPPSAVDYVPETCWKNTCFGTLPCNADGLTCPIGTNDAQCTPSYYNVYQCRRATAPSANICLKVSVLVAVPVPLRPAAELFSCAEGGGQGGVH